MRLGRVIGVFADVHGADRTLSRALDVCRVEGVETIALLGDLFDRVEQADRVARALQGWDVVGVYGNHEREVALNVAAGRISLQPETVALLAGLGERVMVDDVCLVHEEAQWFRHDPIATLFSRAPAANGHQAGARITFAGHTHVRAASNERGPLDLGRNTLTLDAARRYLINPGALAAGQFAIWRRDEGRVEFRQLAW